MLLAAGGDPDAPAGELGDTPLLRAVRNRHPALVCTVPGSTWKSEHDEISSVKMFA